MTNILSLVAVSVPFFGKNFPSNSSLHSISLLHLMPLNVTAFLCCLFFLQYQGYREEHCLVVIDEHEDTENRSCQEKICFARLKNCLH